MSSSSYSSSSYSSSSSSLTAECVSNADVLSDEFTDDALPGWTVNGTYGVAAVVLDTYLDLTVTNPGAGRSVSVLRDVGNSENIGDGAGCVISLYIKPIKLDVISTTVPNDFYVEWGRTSSKFSGFSFAKVSSSPDVYGVYEWTGTSSYTQLPGVSFTVNTDWQEWTFRLYSNYTKYDVYKDNVLVIDNRALPDVTGTGDINGRIVLAQYGNAAVSMQTLTEWIKIGGFCQGESSSSSAS
jgi:hypothetical protein